MSKKTVSIYLAVEAEDDDEAVELAVERIKYGDYCRDNFEVEDEPRI